LSETYGFDHIDSASRVREVIKKLANKEIDKAVPQPLVGRVMSVDLPRLRATVWFPNDEQPIEVKLLSSVIPGDWQHKSARGAFDSLSGYGSRVVVERLNNSLYVTQVLTGGQFSFDSQTMGHSIVAQRATPITAGDVTSIVPIVGDPHETFINCTIEDFTVADGGAIQFGPFTGVNTLPDAGWMEVTVTAQGAAVKYYNFALNPLYDFQYTGGNGALDSWFRLVPEKQICDIKGQTIDFDFEVTLKKTPYGNPIDFEENQELWMRVIKRGSSWTGLSCQVTIRGTNIIKGRSLSGRELFMQDVLASPAEAKGYLGFHNSQVIFRDFDDYGVLDNFGRTVTSGWGTSDSYTTYTVRSGSASTNYGVDGTRAYISATANSAYYITLDKSNAGNADMYWDVTIPTMPTGAEFQTGAIMRYVDNANMMLCKVIFNTNGTIALSLVSGSGGVFTPYGTDYNPGFTYSAGDTIRCRARAFLSAGFIKAWNPATMREPDWVKIEGGFPAGVSSNVSGLFFQPGGANTNTKPVRAYFDRVRLTVYPKGQDNSGKQWHTGPWRSGLLRLADNLQKTWLLQGNFTWDRTNGLKWFGQIMFSGVGQHRMGLGAGISQMQYPPATSISGFTIPIVPNGGSKTVGSGGILLDPGEALWLAIPPGQTWENLYEYLFIVSATATADFDMPEWAVLIAYRNTSTNLGPDLRLGNGMHLDAWKPLTYLNGWADNGAAPHGSYRLQDPNHLEIIGRMTPGTKTNGTDCFTIPGIYNPIYPVTLYGMCNGQVTGESPHFELNGGTATCYGIGTSTIVSIQQVLPIDPPA
jgi:hypothetical protein